MRDQLSGCGSSRAPTDATARFPSAPPGERKFVGREPELAELRGHLDAVVGGTGRSVVIAGDAGIGKTRLAWEFTLDARARGALVLWGRCWEAGGAPSYWPWIEVLRQALTGEHLPHELSLGPHGAYVAQLVPELCDHLTGLQEPLPTPSDPDSARFSMFDAIARLLRAVANTAPLVVVIDDLHVADPASLLLLSFLARSLRGERLLLLGTCRDPDAYLTPALAPLLADIGRQAKRLPLLGLSARDVCHLIQHAAGQPPSDSLVSRIHRITDGNPFFVDEILQLLASEGTTVTDDPHLPLRIPEGIREAVRRRLEQLPNESATILEVAAVIGREFDAGVMRLASGTNQLDVLDALDRPIKHGLVAEMSGAAGRFQFRHALIREVVYEGLPAARRLLLHRKVGDALESLSRSDPERYVAELAHHFLVAAPCGDDVRFVDYGPRAARRALARMAFEEAVSLYERTLDALPFAPPDERLTCKVLLALGEAKEWANDAAGSREAFERAATIARRLGASDLLVEAALGVGAIQALKFTATSRCESAPELLREALDAIEPSDDTSRSRLLARLALHSLSSGERANALKLSTIAVTIARSSGNVTSLGHTLTARHAVLYGPDHIDERSWISNEVLELGHRVGSRDLALRGHALRFTTLFELGQIHEADIALSAHSALADQSGDPFERWANLVWRAARVLMEGRFDDAVQYSQRALALAREVPGLHATDHYAPITFAGQTILIDETRDGSLPDPEVIAHFRSRYPEISAWRVAYLSGLTRSGAKDAVRNELDFLDCRDFADFDRNGTWLASMSYVSEAIELIGDCHRAHLVYQLLAPFHDRNVTVSHIASRGSVSRWLGLLAATMGRWPDAEAHFQSALAMNQHMGARALVANTRHDYGRLLAKESDNCARRRASTLLEEALLEATQLGMSGLANRCKIAIDTLTQRAAVNSATPRSTSLLLHREQQVWILEYRGKRVHLKDSKGLRYIAALLDQANREVHAADLVALLAPNVDNQRRESARPTSVLTHMTEMLIDTRARRAYERRLSELSADLESAEQSGEPEQVLAMREEIGALRRELARAIGLRNRTRKTSDAERARVRVTRAIRLALTRIAAADDESAAYLSRYIRTGTYCRFQPPK